MGNSVKTDKEIQLDLGLVGSYYNLHPTQALRGLAWVKTERITGRQQVKGVLKTAY